MIELQKIGDLVVYKLRLVSDFGEKQTSNENAGAKRRIGGLSLLSRRMSPVHVSREKQTSNENAGAIRRIGGLSPITTDVIRSCLAHAIVLK